MRIRECATTPEGSTLFKKCLFKLGKCPLPIDVDDTSNTYDGANIVPEQGILALNTVKNVTKEICDLIKLHLHVPVNDSSDYCVETSSNTCIYTVGTNSRYLLSEGGDLSVPSFVFILSAFPRSGSKKREVDKENKFIQIFSFGGGVSAVGGDGAVLLQSLHDPHTANACILSRMKPFIRKTHDTGTSGAISANSCKPRPVQRDLVSVVRVVDKTGRASILEVHDTGFKAVDKIIRCIGAMQEYHSDRTSTSTYRMSIACNELYSLVFLLDHGTFSLMLYHTDDILKNEGRPVRTLAPIITLSHCFHFMGSIVEKRHYNAIESQSVTVANSMQTVAKPRCRISGMRTVVHMMLQREKPAFPIRVMVRDRAAERYGDMQDVDITQVICAMKFVSDKKKLTSFLQGAHGGSIVATLVQNDTLIPRRYLPSTTGNSGMGGSEQSLSSDFRIHPCSALRDAIAHQNRHILKRLEKSPGLSIHEVCRVLLSGISFCYSRAYTIEPTDVHHGVSVHLINRSDFPTDCNDAVNTMLTHVVGIMQVETPVLWAQVSHNFCVQARVAQKNFKIEIECHTTNEGLVFFRHQGGVATKSRDFLSVYIPPEVIISRLSDPGKSTTDDTHVAQTTPAAIPLHPHPVGVHTDHPLVKVAMKLSAENLLTKETLLRNATETLVILNAICVHNKRFFAVRGGANKHHTFLRMAWFDTYTRRAVRLCGGVQNVHFYDIYAHLGNLAELPLIGVGYWANVPYV